MKKGLEKYWWITTEHTDINSPFVNYAITQKYRNYAKLKSVAWRWYKIKLGRKDLGAREKVILWLLCERLKASSYSVWDSYEYMSLALGMNRKTIKKGIERLAECNVIVIALEGEEARAMKSLPKQRRVKKHILLVGFSHALARALSE